MTALDPRDDFLALGDVIERIAARIIPTRYASILFRSRTEARWAVFFDALKARWQYEAEGYDIDGLRYLPDFWLPDWHIFVEVKGAAPTDTELEKARRLAVGTGKPVLIVIGDPGCRRGFLFEPSTPPSWRADFEIADHTAFFSKCRRCDRIGLHLALGPVLDETDAGQWGFGFRRIGRCDDAACGDKVAWRGYGVEEAIAAALNERFEDRRQDAVEGGTHDHH